jgi:hypothetical protein
VSLQARVRPSVQGEIDRNTEDRFMINKGVCNVFHYDSFGDHLQTCRVKSVDSQVHDWVVYRVGGILGSVGHRVKIHKITTGTGNGRGDLEMKDCVVLQKPQERTDRLPPPRTLILDFTLTHT